jgi:hypothetical protein
MKDEKQIMISVLPYCIYYGKVKKVEFVGPNLQSSVVDPDSLNADPNTVPDPAFLVNPDSDSDPDSRFR